MSAKTVEDFYKEYRSGRNPITDERNQFKDLTDEIVWYAAIKSMESKVTAGNKASAAIAEIISMIEVGTKAGRDNGELLSEVYEALCQQHT